jgi:hypothetical protein
MRKLAIVVSEMVPDVENIPEALSEASSIPKITRLGLGGLLSD